MSNTPNARATPVALRTGSWEGRGPTWFHDFAARALGVIQALVEADGAAEDAPLVAELERLARQFGLQTSLAAPAGSADACLYRSRLVAQRALRRRDEQRQEIGGIVRLVTEAVGTMSAEMGLAQDSIGASADRIADIARLDDPRQMRMLLEAQVATLRQAAAERRQSWDAHQSALTTRMSALECQLQDARRDACRDPLTELGNRAAFDREMETRLGIPGARFVLALLDVDHLKKVNDTHGHPAGDRMLVAVARALRKKLRAEDFIARLGGDEFGVIASHLTLAQAESRFQSVLATLFDGGVEERTPVVPTLSCGIAEYSGGDTPSSLFDRADQALYAAKRQGRNRVVGKSRSFLRDLLRR